MGSLSPSLFSQLIGRLIVIHSLNLFVHLIAFHSFGQSRLNSVNLLQYRQKDSALIAQYRKSRSNACRTRLQA